MQVEVLALSRSQKELERFKKKLEISSKSVTHKAVFSMCPCSFTQRRSAAGIRESDRPVGASVHGSPRTREAASETRGHVAERERETGWCVLPARELAVNITVDWST